MPLSPEPMEHLEAIAQLICKRLDKLAEDLEAGIGTANEDEDKLEAASVQYTKYPSAIRVSTPADHGCDLTWDEDYAGIDVEFHYDGGPTPGDVRLMSWANVSKHAHQAIAEEIAQQLGV